MPTSNTIIFGPTGHVGSAVTRNIHHYGAKTVFLAMRYPQKPIPGLSLDQEQERSFQRVQADLTKPETIHAAVEKSGAKRAFIYMARGSSDNMRSSIEALKSAGIEYVVFLSSVSVQGDIRSIQPSKIIAWPHAQVEINLEEIFGRKGFVAVRPAFFASNAMWWKRMICEGEVKLVYPEAKLDWISPGDIGRVCAALLAGGLRPVDEADERNFVRLYGPELVSQRDAFGIIGRAIGKDIKVTQLDEHEALEVFEKEIGMPGLMGKSIINFLKMRAGIEESDRADQGPAYEEAVSNVPKYAGGQPTRFEEWVEENRKEFSS